MKNFKFKAFVGLQFSEFLTNAEWQNTYDEIERLSEYYNFTVGDIIIVKKIKFAFAKTERSLVQVKDQFHWINTDKVLIIQFTADIDAFKANGLNIDAFIEKRICDLIIAISIAKKGAILVSTIKAFVNDGVFMDLSPIIHHVDLCLNYAKKIKWPKLKIIDLQKTIHWLSSFQESTDGLSKNKVGRALNAYSYLFNDVGGSDDASGLFWSMVGLEAIYAVGNANIVNQVNSKSQIFLGERKEFKKSFNEMYDYRSRFVHGDLDIVNKSVLFDLTDEVSKHWEDLGNSENLATAILVATFQKLIITDRSSVEFQYKVVAKSR